MDRRELMAMMALAANVPLSNPAPAHASGKTWIDELQSSNVPGGVRVSIYTPPGYGGTPAEAYPLILLLHGGGGSEQDLLRFTPTIDRAMAEGRIPQVVVAIPGARRSLYMDYRDGSQRWETFIIAELLPHLRQSLQVSPDHGGTSVAGWSMGGLGSLRLAFKHPDRFAALAALEPAIEPVLFWSEIGPHVRFWRSEGLTREMFGSPIDTTYWEANNPATIARRDPERLLGLGIYLDEHGNDTGPPRRVGCLLGSARSISHRGFFAPTRANATSTKRLMDRVLKETDVKERFAERDIRAKVGSDAETVEKAAHIPGSINPRIVRKHYRRKPDVIR